VTALEEEWSPFRRALRQQDKPRFDHLFEQGRAYAHAAGYLNHPTSEVPLLVSILLAHERRLDALEAEHDLPDDHQDQDDSAPEDPSHAVHD
jgi:hypothetical protein